MASLKLLFLTLLLMSGGFPPLCGINISNDMAMDVSMPKSVEDSPSTENAAVILNLHERRNQYCRLPAKCEQHNNSTCLGVKLPYSSLTTHLVALSREQATKELKYWETTLSLLPKCWAVIQPFLCALYMPKCEDGIVHLPSQEMCKMAASSCPTFAEQHHWISPLRCADIIRFPPTCKNELRELQFNTSTQCMPPLVPTDNPSAYLEGVEGCGMPCINPLYTPEEHMIFQKAMGWVIGLLIIMSSFTVLSFLIQWRHTKGFPVAAVFYMNVCSLVTSICFLVQFIPGARESLICRKDGTLRTGESSPGENYLCKIAFAVMYYFLIAKFIWFVIYTYAWNLQVQAHVTGKIKDIHKRRAYFHLGAWFLPILPTTVALALECVDGNSELGICFVSMESHIRLFFFLVPMIVCVCVGAIFSFRVRGCIKEIIKGSEDVISQGSAAKVRRLLCNVMISTIGGFVLVLVAGYVHMYEFQNRDSWRSSFRNFITCKIMQGDTVDEAKNRCMISKPDVIVIYAQLALIFGGGCLTNFWVWSPSNFHTWCHFIFKVFNKEDEPLKLQKHQVIARTFAKREALNRLGRISISIHSARDDPVGLDFELNSAASRGMSSTWVAALPKLVTRRGALRAGSTSSQLRSSYDSDMSYGRGSLDSRRHSVDSQLSVAMGDNGKRQPVTPIGGVSAGRVKSRRRQRRRTGFFRRSFTARRSSSTSQDSQLSAQLLSSLAMALPSIQTCVPNMRLRTGNAALDDDLPFDINSPALAPELLAPLFRLFHGNMSGTDEENAKGRESTKELPGIGASSQDKGDKESPPNERTTLKKAPTGLSVSPSSSDEETKPDQNCLDSKINGGSRRPQSKRYSKHDASKKSGEDDLPMLDRESGKVNENDDVDSSEETRTCTSRLKHAREIGTQTSMLSVNEIDGGVNF